MAAKVDRRACGLAALAWACAPAPVLAQEPADQAGVSFGDIVVTAQRRSESLQKVPLAVTALSGDSLQSRGVENAEGLRYTVPNFSIGTNNGVPRISIRGVGITGNLIGQESPVAAHLNGIYLARPTSLIAGLYDIDRVEVLRGPQGTLYGRNATGGAINVHTKRPTEDAEGFVTLRYGNYNDIRVEGAVSGALVEGGKIMQRVAFMTNHHDGYGENETTGRSIDNLHVFGVRSTTVIKPVEDLSITVIADYDRQRDRSGQYQYLGALGDTDEPGSPQTPPLSFVYGGKPAEGKRNINGTFDPSYRRESWGVTSDIQLSLGDLEIRSFTGYRNLDWLIKSNISGGDVFSFLYFQGEKSKQFSQDIQFNISTDRFDLVFGGYYLHEKYDGPQNVPFDPRFAIPTAAPGLVQGYSARGLQTDKVYAAYGQGNFRATDALTLTVGARYSYEKKTATSCTEFDLFSPPESLYGINQICIFYNDSWKSFTPKFGVQYQINPDAMAYVSASKGFKAGGYNLGSLQPRGVRPETVWAYEGGVKATLFDRKVRANLAAFYYKYKDLQVSAIDASGQNNSLENAAGLKSYGAELELWANPIRNLDLSATIAWLHSRYTEYVSFEEARPALGPQDLSGNKAPQSPDYTISLSASYTVPMSWGELTLRGDSYFVGEVEFSQFNRPLARQDATSRHDVTLTATTSDDAWSVSAYVRNLTDRLTIASANPTSVVGGWPLMGSYEPPRTYGVSVTRRF